MWPILVAIGGALGAWWLLSGNDKPQRPTVSDSGLDTIGYRDSDKFYYWVTAASEGSDGSTGLVDVSFENWDSAWKYYKTLKAFFDENHKNLTCLEGVEAVVLELRKIYPEQGYDGSQPVSVNTWRCEEP